jgi:hypothetical protein
MLLPLNLEPETSAKSHIVILSGANDLVSYYNYKILQSLRSLRMTGEGTFAEVSTLNFSRQFLMAYGPPINYEKSGRAGIARPIPLNYLVCRTHPTKDFSEQVTVVGY